MKLVFDPVVVARGVIGLAEVVAQEAGKRPWRQVLADAAKVIVATAVTSATVSHKGIVLLENGRVPHEGRLLGGR